MNERVQVIPRWIDGEFERGVDRREYDKGMPSKKLRYKTDKLL